MSDRARRLLGLVGQVSLIGLCLLVMVAYVGARGSVVEQFGTRAGSTYFVEFSAGHLRLVRQAVSPAVSGGFTADTSRLDVENVFTINGPFPGFVQAGGPVWWHGVMLEHEKMGWSCPPGTLGGLGAPLPGSIFIFDYWSCGAAYVVLSGFFLVVFSLSVAGRVVLRNRRAAKGFEVIGVGENGK